MGDRVKLDAIDVVELNEAFAPRHCGCAIGIRDDDARVNPMAAPLRLEYPLA